MLELDYMETLDYDQLVAYLQECNFSKEDLKETLDMLGFKVPSDVNSLPKLRAFTARQIVETKLFTDIANGGGRMQHG